MHNTVTDPIYTIIFAMGAGAAIMILARKLHISAISLLLLAGIALGPQFSGAVHPELLGGGLNIFISLAVAIILFEGGLALDYSGYKKAGPSIRLLLSAGVLITLLSVTLAIRVLFRFPWRFSLLAASLVVVTGPTVITPLLRRLKLKKEIHHILHWEGVLVDPIGVFVAIICYKLVDVQGDTAGIILAQTALRVVVGIGAGLICGGGLYYLIKKEYIPEDQTNISTLTGAVLVFGIANLIVPESGLLSVVVSGFILGITKPGPLKKIRIFQEEITEILIGMLFILLAANLDLARTLQFGTRGLILLGIVMLVARPLAVFVSTAESELHVRDKLFLSWLAPRGIVAASMATLFFVRLRAAGHPDAWFIETFTFMVIIATVVLQGTSAGLVADLLKVHRPRPRGWMIVGAHALSEQLVRLLGGRGRVECLIVDSNPKNCNELTRKELPVICADAQDIELYDDERFVGIGNLLALTDNDVLNSVLCQHWTEVFGADHVFRWSPAERPDRQEKPMAGQPVWTFLPRPAIVAGDLIRGDAHLAYGVVTDRDQRKNLHPLACVHPGSRSAVLKVPPEQDQKDPGNIIHIIREATFIHRITTPRLITSLDKGGNAEVIGRLLEMISHELPTISKDYIYNEMIEREKGFSTAVGLGVAIPHTYCRELSSPVCAIARTPHGVDWQAFDGEAVSLVFLVLSPPGDPEKHLAILSLIAQLTTDPKMLEKLKTTEDPKELYKAIQAKEITLFY